MGSVLIWSAGRNRAYVIVKENFSEDGDGSLTNLPEDLGQTIEKAWQRAKAVQGFMAENELRFLAMLAACIPAEGSIVEIGSFKGKSTVALATVCDRYGLDPVVAIDPHAGLSYLGPGMPQQTQTFDEFLGSIKDAGVEHKVEVRRAHSSDVAKLWERPIRLLWIDGDHSYAGCKEDFDLFLPHLSNGGVVAFHDALNAFDGPIRVFAEEVLRSDSFGAAGFVHSIAWAQYRPSDGARFSEQRAKVERVASRLVPFVNGGPLVGLRKIVYKVHRSRVPRKPISAEEWMRLISTTSVT
jgi:MMP 1-O-methyltransferase